MPRKPVWTTSNFVLYVGGFTVLVGAAVSLIYLASESGDAGLVAWTLLPLVVLCAIAYAFRLRSEWIPAGLFAFATLAVWLVFLGSLLEWWGWAPAEDGSAFDGWNWGLWLMLVIGIVTASVALSVFEFPLLVVFPLVLSWLLVVDVLSGGGDWSYVLTLLIGLLYLGIGSALGGPSGFWVHVVAGVLVGGALLQWWNSSDTDWVLVALTGLAFVGIARGTGRSSWAVLGIIGIFAASVHFVTQWSGVEALPFFFAGEGGGELRPWVPGLVYGLLGLFFVVLGLGVRRRTEEPAP
ncbi:MAG: hypothetical protein WD689_07075 [Gaiellaceae bacterium]